MNQINQTNQMNQIMDERKKIWDDIAGANNYQISNDGSAVVIFGHSAIRLSCKGNRHSAIVSGSNDGLEAKPEAAVCGLS
jgi:hypothetical protein